MSTKSWSIQPKEVFDVAPVIPVIVIKDAAKAIPLAQALVAGGVPIMEITLRSSQALEAVTLVRQQLPEILVGVGTVLNVEQLQASVDAGAQFAVSPGASVSLLEAAQKAVIPLIPGVATMSEVQTALELGYDHLKFFPAEALGGVKTLKAFSGPVPSVRFCATGGISPANYEAYLALPQVPCVGGSWLVPSSLIESEDWSAITALCLQVQAQS
jgi:2-dehydro-3-deoxyphosphogluconate aldolase/(4S)-4-hydroxy-2-oxoglutarate aldolase